MAHLFIRVELRGSPSWQDYENLHAYMEKNVSVGLGPSGQLMVMV
jgi:hypothetical protein